jgi:uncharacterized membrane protein
VPCPFIAHTQLNSGDFVVVTKIDGNSITVSNHDWNNHKLNAAEFKKIFSGTVLAAEAAPVVKMASFSNFSKAIKLPAIVVGLLFVLASVLILHPGYFANPYWPAWLLTLFKTAGFAVSVLLLIQSVDSNNPLVQKLCQTSSKINCNAILSSKAAKVFEGLSWSEVGFYYFAGTWLMLLFGGGGASIWLVLALFNFVSLPYTVYSIYYQARVAKQWCVLCCIVQGLLWLEATTFFFSVPFSITAWGNVLPNGPETLITLSCMLAPVILWLMLKPLFLKLQLLQPLKNQLRNFKYNTEIFNKLLNDKPRYITPEREWSIVLGNPEALNVITMVSNLYCNPCAQAHKLLEEWLSSANNIQVRVVFVAGSADNDKRREAAMQLMTINAAGDKEKTEQALSDWYNRKTDAEWMKKYPVTVDAAVAEKLNKQTHWCEMAEIHATPTIVVNGFELPHIYQVSDLKYMLAN